MLTVTIELNIYNIDIRSDVKLNEKEYGGGRYFWPLLADVTDSLTVSKKTPLVLQLIREKLGNSTLLSESL